ncbi:MAG: transcription antitermination factor NusB [Candidatus Uhrbacteria bacterium]|nr:transcription antitermination factor NusB [Patescibacteria group bacterium]MBU1906880.1 transcription antitermination factor NusB [Patescibacteria group bacterium]
MSNRHLARTIALQSLYQWDFLEQPTEKIDEIVGRNKDEFAPQFDDGGFIMELVKGVLDHQSEIDELITHFAPDWPLETITTVDRNVLRLGTFELKFSDNVPSKVAINEAIELAKSFGGEASGRFVNGVLGAIYKDMIKRGEEKEVDKLPPKKERKAEELKEKSEK